MVRVLLYLVLVGIFAFAAIWIVDRPGAVAIDWQGYHVDMSVAVAAALVAATACGALVLWNVMRWILQGPEAFAMFRKNRRRAKGYDAIARGVVAVGTGDAKRAGKEATEARRLLGREPLTLVLAAQAAQLSGDREGAETAFRAMTERAETRSLGLRGLFVEAERRGDRAAAKSLAEEAVRQAPDTPWAGQALFEFQCAERDWGGALSTLERLGANRLIGKPEARRKRAVLMTAQAMDGAGGPAAAAKRAREAHGIAPDFTPAAALAARLLAEQGEHRKAMKIVETTWAKATHPDLAEVYVHVKPGDSARDKLKRARSLAERSGDDPEGLIAVARAALAAREFDTARAAVDKVLGVRPTARACVLMAEIEELQNGDSGRAREWLGRALRMPRDPAWVADGVASDAWAPVSPVTGKLDAFVWKTPVEEARPKLAADAWLDQAPAEREMKSVAPPPPPPPAAPPAIDKPAPAAKLDVLPRAMPELVDDAPAASPVEASKPEASKSETPKPEATKSEASKSETSKPETSKPEAQKPEAPKLDLAKPEAGKPKALAKPTAAVFPLARSPDDPGPNGPGQGDTMDGGRGFPGSRPAY